MGRATTARALAFALLACCAGAASGAGQSASASIAGVLRRADRAPLLHTTIYLVPRDSAQRFRAALTDSAGGFSFDGLRAGDYYLRVDRVGYESEWSEPKPVADGQRLRLDLTSDPAAVRLWPNAATGVCLRGNEIGQDTALATLWREARKAATARRLFDLTYRYRVDTSEMLTFQRSYSRRTARHRLTSTPALAHTLAQRGAYAGYGVGMDSTRLVAVPEMLEVLSDDLSHNHCLSRLPDHFTEHSIRFEPLAAIPDARATEIAGNIVLGEDFTLKRIEFEYRRGSISFSRGYVEFGGGPKKSPVRFAKFILVRMFDAPVTSTEHIELDPRAYDRGGRDVYERASVYVHYSSFVSEAREP